MFPWLEVRGCARNDAPRDGLVLSWTVGTVGCVPAADDKVTVALDASIVDRARAEFGEGGDSDAAIVESALNALFLDRLLDATQARSDLTPEQADELAYSEVKAARRERGAA